MLSRVRLRRAYGEIRVWPVNIAIVRAFVRLRKMLLTNTDRARKLADLEQKYDAQFKVVFDAIRQLMAPSPAPPGPQIGFHVKEDAVPYRTRKRGQRCQKCGPTPAFVHPWLKIFAATSRASTFLTPFSTKPGQGGGIQSGRPSFRSLTASNCARYFASGYGRIVQHPFRPAPLPA
jgi:hypothetical protein